MDRLPSATPGPVAIRYPRDKSSGLESESLKLLPWERGELLREGDHLLIVTAGTVLAAALEAAEKLYWQGIKAAVINARFVKPLDGELILRWAKQCGRILTVEENILNGGFGSGVVDLLEKNDLVIPVKRLGVDDQFVAHGSRAQMLACHGLDAEGIFIAALNFCGQQ